VPYLGTIRDGLQSHGTRGLTLAAVLVLLGGYSVVQIVGGLRDRRRKGASSEVDPSSDLAAAGATGGSVALPSGTGEIRCSMIEVPVHAFDGVDPEFVARLLQGRCAPAGPDRVRIIVEGTPERLALIRELVEPFVTASVTSARADGESTANLPRLAVVRENAS
jgi:hypothetical protein